MQDRWPDMNAHSLRRGASYALAAHAQWRQPLDLRPGARIYAWRFAASGTCRVTVRVDNRAPVNDVGELEADARFPGGLIVQAHAELEVWSTCTALQLVRFAYQWTP